MASAPMPFLGSLLSWALALALRTVWSFVGSPIMYRWLSQLRPPIAATMICNGARTLGSERSLNSGSINFTVPSSLRTRATACPRTPRTLTMMETKNLWALATLSVTVAWSLAQISPKDPKTLATASMPISSSRSRTLPMISFSSPCTPSTIAGGTGSFMDLKMAPSLSPTKCSSTPLQETT